MGDSHWKLFTEKTRAKYKILNNHTVHTALVASGEVESCGTCTSQMDLDVWDIATWDGGLACLLHG